MSVILPKPVASGCVGCNLAVRDFEMTMRDKPGFIGLSEYAAMPDPKPVFTLDGVEVAETHIVAVVPGENGYLLMNWSDGGRAMICTCDTITFAVKRNLFRGKVNVRRSPGSGLLIPV